MQTIATTATTTTAIAEIQLATFQETKYSFVLRFLVFQINIIPFLKIYIIPFFVHGKVTSLMFIFLFSPYVLGLRGYIEEDYIRKYSLQFFVIFIIFHIE